MRDFFGVGIATAIQADLHFASRTGFDSGGDEEVVSPDNRTGVPEAGNGRLPADVLAGGDIPGDGNRVIGQARSVRPAKLGPVFGGGEGTEG